MITESTDLDYLIDQLRLHLQDVTEPYEFSDEYLRSALVSALKALGHRWNYRYLIDASYVVTRGPNYDFSFASPPVIQYYDEIIIILQSSIMIKLGRNRAQAANVVSWRDAEISYSTIASSRAMTDDLQRDINWLNALLPTKRLFAGDRQALVGFEHFYEDIVGLE